MAEMRSVKRERAVGRENTEAARQLRRTLTPAEKALWEAIRDRRLEGLKFRRQQPIGPFIVDFCCVERGFAIELDGSVHDAQAEYDAGRTEHLEAYGYAVLRFSNHDVLNNINAVLDVIRTALSEVGP